MDADQKQINAIKALVSASRNSFSYSEVIRELDRFGPDILPYIINNYEDLSIQILSAQTDFADSIGVKIPGERKKVVECLASFYGKSNLVNLADAINQSLSTLNVSYRLPDSFSQNLTALIEKAASFTIGLRNLDFAYKKIQIDEIYPYVKKYYQQTRMALQNSYEHLKSSLDFISQNIYNVELAKRQAERTLLSSGYLKIGLQNKDIGELANIIFSEMVAAESILLAREEKKSDTVSADEILDQIVKILLGLPRIV